jgi:hypothetical protein
MGNRPTVIDGAQQKKKTGRDGFLRPDDVIQQNGSAITEADIQVAERRAYWKMKHPERNKKSKVRGH